MMWWIVTIVTGVAALCSIYLLWQFMKFIFKVLFEGPNA
jgi:hypothetical protein